MANTESHVSADSAIVLSDEHYPVLTVTWFGQPTAGTVDAYLAWLLRMTRIALEKQDRFVVVGDTTEIGSRPGPEFRRQMAEVIQQFHEAAGDSLLGVFTVVTNPLIRTMIKMTLFIARRSVSFTPTKSLQEAVELSLARLDEAGQARPTSLDPLTYRRPAHPVDGH